ncbi:MAG: NAD(P)/FAD-dependent oxidoreductase [Bryobacterales bacterium]|nr:NAD(P)/FAD-dependent oxidoreductase [Bryobacterales bacterium]
MKSFDAVVIGGGAAGLMCAIAAGRRGRRVAVVEHAADIGKKILISGGGRCNFTNLHCSPRNFLSANPHFAKSALARYTPADFIAMVEKHGIPYHEKTLGQLFCDQSAHDIVRMLRSECDDAGVRIVTGCRVVEVRRPAEFVVETNRGEFRAPAVVIATGGLSIPKMGATDFGYRIAKQFGVKVRACRPALTPLLVEGCAEISGVSADVAAAAGGQEFRERMLFTHRGLSGPAILQISSYWEPGTSVRIDLLPRVDILAELIARRGERTETKTIVAAHLPKRLTDLWFERNVQSRPVAKASDRELERLAGALHGWEVLPRGIEGYEKAEVTAGGVDTDDLSARTFEARAVRGLHFIGEVLDVTGHLGGFNFQWAWASGNAAGESL